MKLKNAGDNIRGLSICDDYTQEDRELMQIMHDEAKRRNEEERGRKHQVLESKGRGARWAAGSEGQHPN